MNDSPPRLASLPSYYQSVVEADWIDEFGHMNMSTYVLACDHATYGFWHYVNDNRNLEARAGAEYAVIETHVNYLDELRLDDPFIVHTQLLSADEKRFHLFHELRHQEQGYVAATNEIMSLSFNLNTRSVMPFVGQVRDNLQALLREHAAIARHKNAGRSIVRLKKDREA